MSEQFWEIYELLQASYSVELNCKTILPNYLRVLGVWFLFQEVSQTSGERL